MDTIQNSVAQRTAELLASQGYRRTSSKLGTLSRIDRPDWVDVLAKALRRSPAEFYGPGESTPKTCWCDCYRRAHSEDTITVSPGLAKLVPGSSFDPVGYVPSFTKASAARVRDFVDPLLVTADRVLEAARGEDPEALKAMLLRLETQVRDARSMLK